MMTARSRGISQIGTGQPIPQIRGRKILIRRSPVIIVMGSLVRALEIVLTVVMGNHRNRATLTPALAATPTGKALPVTGSHSRGTVPMGNPLVVTASRAVMDSHPEAIAPMGAHILLPLVPDSPAPRTAATVSRRTRRINPERAAAITVRPGHMANRSRGAAPTGNNRDKTIPVAIASRKKP